MPNHHILLQKVRAQFSKNRIMEILLMYQLSAQELEVVRGRVYMLRLKLLFQELLDRLFQNYHPTT